MNFYCAYWVSDDMPESRRRELRRYFDLQRLSKQRFGARQIIATNLDYPDAVPLELPAGFTREYALFARWFGLKALLEDGLEFPLVMHDHDTFVRRKLPMHQHAILAGSTSGQHFSEQLVVFPLASRELLINYIDQLYTLDFVCATRNGYGCEIRHEGMYSSEEAAQAMIEPPFGSFPVQDKLAVKDHVSFSICDLHSLDPGHVVGDEIPHYAHAVHSHINKGPISDALLEWLDVVC